MWKSAKNGLISRQAKIKKPDSLKFFEVTADYYEESFYLPRMIKSVISDFVFGRIHSEIRKLS